MGYMEAVNMSAEASMTDSIGDVKDSTSMSKDKER